MKFQGSAGRRPRSTSPAPAAAERAGFARAVPQRGPTAGIARDAADARFELFVHCAEQIELLRAAPAGVRFKVWLKLDSGMNRLGFKGAEFQAAHAALSALAALQGPVNLCTHLASADTPERPSTAEQLRVFAAATRTLSGERSVGSSAALLSFPESHADWIRPGLLLYGVSPFAGSTGADHGLRPVMTLKSQPRRSLGWTSRNSRAESRRGSTHPPDEAEPPVAETSPVR